MTSRLFGLELKPVTLMNLRDLLWFIWNIFNKTYQCDSISVTRKNKKLKIKTQSTLGPNQIIPVLFWECSPQK